MQKIERFLDTKNIPVSDFNNIYYLSTMPIAYKGSITTFY